MFSLMITD